MRLLFSFTSIDSFFFVKYFYFFDKYLSIYTQRLCLLTSLLVCFGLSSPLQKRLDFFKTRMPKKLVNYTFNRSPHIFSKSKESIVDLRFSRALFINIYNFFSSYWFDFFFTEFTISLLSWLPSTIMLKVRFYINYFFSF